MEKITATKLRMLKFFNIPYFPDVWKQTKSLEQYLRTMMLMGYRDYTFQDTEKIFYKEIKEILE